MTRGFLSVLLLGVTAFVCARTGAEPLDAATCGQLRGEQVRMEQSGVRASMEKGPQWAKANLGTDKLDQIRRLMDLDEQLIFRCGSRNLVELPPDADADPPPAKADEEGKDTASPGKADGPAAAKADKKAPAEAAKPPAAKPKTKEATKAPPPTAKTPAVTKDAGSAPEKAAPAKAKPKPKVDDAYKPPPSNPNADPFANQPGVAK